VAKYKPCEPLIPEKQSAQTLKKSLDERLTNPPQGAIIRPSKGDDSKGTGERERAGRGGSQSHKLRRLGAPTEAWAVLNQGQALASVPHPRRGRERDPETAGMVKMGTNVPIFYIAGLRAGQ